MEASVKNSVTDFIMAPDVATIAVGVVLFPQFELLDVTGPLEALNMLGHQGTDNLVLHFVARSLSPVSCGPILPDKLGLAFTGPQTFTPTHAFADCPPLDVLLVPGGLGALSPTPSGQPADVDDAVAFIRERFPALRYLLTVCTGSGLAARAGVLDGLRATTNKRRWTQVAALGPHTHWVGHARWVVSGKVWTTSGVAAGIDGTLAWIAEVFGDAMADDVCRRMEYVRQTDPGNDPFAALYQVADVPPTG